MFLSELRATNFRLYGENDRALTLPLRPGLTVLVGENDTGKTAVIDALRLVLGTRDQENFRVEEADFHQPSDGSARRTEMSIRCRFEGLSTADQGAFVEYLTYEERGGARVPILYITWKATAAARAVGRRRYATSEVRSGREGDGPSLDLNAKQLICATYLRPLRDAERALSAGRGSRLSQILQHTKDVRDHGQPYDARSAIPLKPEELSILGIGDYTNALLAQHTGVRTARERLNMDYLNELSFPGDRLSGAIAVGGAPGDDSARLRQLLEKLDLELRDEGDLLPPSERGLGSKNLLFIACEMLLLGSEDDGHPLLLIEEPEAHLHPQRQLRLMQFLRKKAESARADGQRIQIVVTTHSPTLASAVDLSSLVLVHGQKAFPMGAEHTQLSASDYGFLERFLDATKANLFFARGVLIVEGDAENILLPTLARLLGRDLTASGVSIINVGGTGLGRFARIYLRQDIKSTGMVNVPVACVADLDVMPDCAPEIVGKVGVGEGWPEAKKRRWRAIRDFPSGVDGERERIRRRASDQKVETFVADVWTLEYDLAYAGLAREVWLAAHLADADDRISAGCATVSEILREALRTFVALRRGEDSVPSRAELAARVYAVFVKHSGVSKAAAAQYLAWLLSCRTSSSPTFARRLRSRLPRYLVQAIEHVTPRQSDASIAPPGVEGEGNV